MIAAGPDGRPVVGRVEEVVPEGIALTALGDDGGEVFVRWDDVVYLMQCGPDRDDVLLEAAARWGGA